MVLLPVIGAWHTKLQKMPILSHMRGTLMKAVTSPPKDKYPFYLASFNQLIAPCLPKKWLFNGESYCPPDSPHFDSIYFKLHSLPGSMETSTIRKKCSFLGRLSWQGSSLEKEESLIITTGKFLQTNKYQGFSQRL